MTPAGPASGGGGAGGFAGLDPTARGMAYMLASCVAFALVWTLIRIAGETVSAFMIMFARTAFGCLSLAPDLRARGLAMLRTRRLPIHLIRGVTSVVGTFGIFYAVTVTPLGLVVAISYAAPLFTTMGAVLLFGERIHARRVAALIVGFAGMVLVLRPDAVDFDLGVAAAIAGTLGIAGSMLTIKALAPTDRSDTIVAYAFLLPLPVTFAAALPGWMWPEPVDWVLLIAIGLLASVGQRLLAMAFAQADAGAILPIDFVRLVLATAFGAWLFDERVDWLTGAGALIILASTVYLARREAIAGHAGATGRSDARPERR
ncbi:hypothetical protein CCR85_01860 [Rhodothalassium salexigens]|uniref:DMT family transporter n=1 Tax=Rhodothalassium salexigens TaxID=1086 RepID=UPI0019123FA1|nr:DMT family transporter [Rhodothalassium salexigens]MBK5910237.1 hypothetical protein [Rhodothalassium salexigens]